LRPLRLLHQARSVGVCRVTDSSLPS
jgi:hypothetical protein